MNFYKINLKNPKQTHTPQTTSPCSRDENELTEKTKSKQFNLLKNLASC